jgi:hypothetical protein
VAKAAAPVIGTGKRVERPDWRVLIDALAGLWVMRVGGWSGNPIRGGSQLADGQHSAERYDESANRHGEDACEKNQEGIFCSSQQTWRSHSRVRWLVKKTVQQS